MRVILYGAPLCEKCICHYSAGSFRPSQGQQLSYLMGRAMQICFKDEHEAVR